MKKVLVPVDGSNRSIRSIEMVKQVCSPEDEITLAKVIPAQLYLRADEDNDATSNETRTELEKIAALLPGYQVKICILHGSPAIELVEFARNSKTDLIIMTRSSRGPLRRMGSVASKLVHDATFLDIMVMRESEV